MNDYTALRDSSVYLSTAEFDNLGGWVHDTQFIVNIGSSYLLAHGLGTPVADASAKFCAPVSGCYKVYAFTKDWVARWKKDVAPGLFKVIIDGCESEICGNSGRDWDWQLACTVHLEKGEHSVALKDLTGYEGRCAALFFTTQDDFVPPKSKTDLITFRAQMQGIGDPECVGHFDLAVIGGGFSGMTSAVSAAEQGLKVLLVQDRYVLGGNNSSEVRVWLGGETNFEPYPHIGDITRKFEPASATNYGDKNIGEQYEDGKRLDIVRSYKNITLLLGKFAEETEVADGKIKSITFSDVKTNRLSKATADLFVDATGDATIGYMAQADYEITTNGHMGLSNMWFVTDTGEETVFPQLPWAANMGKYDFPGRKAKDAHGTTSLGCWFWESGMEYEPIENAEQARDLNFRAMYGAMDAIKNVEKNEFYKTYAIGYSSYIAGKRESRRLLGDLILTKSDVLKNRVFPDSCIPCTWHIDVHYPKKECYTVFTEGEAFLTNAYYDNLTAPYYLLPYRCLYSRNISNLFMAGRDISVSHDALGTARVMRTCGMMGEVVGYAASICKKYGALPRDVYESHLEEFLKLMK